MAERWLRYDGTDTGAEGKEKKNSVECKPSVVLAKMNARHQVGNLSGGRPMAVMVLMVMAQDLGEH